MKQIGLSADLVESLLRKREALREDAGDQFRRVAQALLQPREVDDERCQAGAYSVVQLPCETPPFLVLQIEEARAQLGDRPLGALRLRDVLMRRDDADRAPMPSPRQPQL